MNQHAIVESGVEWLGLSQLAEALGGNPTAAGWPHAGLSANRELIDRLQRTLEILTLVDGHAEALADHAHRCSEHEAVLLAVDLRRLADRLQVIGDFIVEAADQVLVLERRILHDLDLRYRAHSDRQHAA